MTGADIVREARTWIKTPFRHQGRTKGMACDCAGLIIGTAHALGISDFDFRRYGRIPQRAVMEAILDANLDRLEAGEQRPGDIAWLRDPKVGGAPRHVVILTERGIIHADSDAGEVVEHSFTPDFSKNVVRYYRYRGVK